MGGVLQSYPPRVLRGKNIGNLLASYIDEYNTIRNRTLPNTPSHYVIAIRDQPLLPPPIRPLSASRTPATVNINSGNVETVAVDPGQHGIGPAINTGHWVASVHRALADKSPWPELFREIGSGPPRREAGDAGVGPGSEDEHVHGDLMFSGCVAFRAGQYRPVSPGRL